MVKNVSYGNSRHPKLLVMSGPAWPKRNYLLSRLHRICTNPIWKKGKLGFKIWLCYQISNFNQFPFKMYIVYSTQWIFLGLKNNIKFILQVINFRQKGVGDASDHDHFKNPIIGMKIVSKLELSDIYVITCIQTYNNNNTSRNFQSYHTEIL